MPIEVSSVSLRQVVRRDAPFVHPEAPLPKKLARLRRGGRRPAFADALLSMKA